MKIETGYQPNCSEVVFNIGDMTKEHVLEILERHGIYEIEIYDEYSDSGKSIILSDDDNPNIPDLIHSASLSLEEEYCACGSYPGISIVGSQHCQSQIFPTMKKIYNVFDNCEWSTDDGGSIIPYEQWLDEGSKPEKGFQLGLCFNVSHITQKQRNKIKQYVYEEFGLKCKSEDNGDLDFGDIPASLISILPKDVGAKREVIIANEVRQKIQKHIDGLGP